MAHLKSAVPDLALFDYEKKVRDPPTTLMSGSKVVLVVRLCFQSDALAQSRPVQRRVRSRFGGCLADLACAHISHLVILCPLSAIKPQGLALATSKSMHQATAKVMQDHQIGRAERPLACGASYKCVGRLGVYMHIIPMPASDVFVSQNTASF